MIKSIKSLTLLYLGILVFPSAAGNVTAQTPPQEKPNIIFVLVDDMGIGDVKAFNA